MRVVPLALSVLASWRVALAQGGGWVVASPARPTVGDTIWLEREVAGAAPWQVRAGKLEPTAEIDPLGDPTVAQRAGGWLVRYPIVAWTPGAHRVQLPPIWRLAPDGRADSTPGGAASVTVASVLPDSLPRPEPRGLLGPLRSTSRHPVPPLVAALVAGGLLAVGVRWRRRGPRPVNPPPQVPLEPEVPDARWLAAGEPKAVAARATGRVRAALARAVPQAHLALDTGECLAAVARARPDAPLRELRELLEQLDRVAFGSTPAHGTDVVPLATMARRLAREFAP